MFSVAFPFLNEVKVAARDHAVGVRVGQGVGAARDNGTLGLILRLMALSLIVSSGVLGLLSVLFLVLFEFVC